MKIWFWKLFGWSYYDFGTGSRTSSLWLRGRTLDQLKSTSPRLVNDLANGELGDVILILDLRGEE